MASTAIAPTVDDLIKYATGIAWKVSQANDDSVANPDRLKARRELVDDWGKTGHPMFKAARQSCPASRREIVAATEAIAHAIILGGDGDTEAFGLAIRELKCAPLVTDTKPTVANDSPGTATVSARIMDEYTKDPSKLNFSAQQWANHLGCSKAAVGESRAWEGFKALKAQEQLAKAKPTDRRRR